MEFILEPFDISINLHQSHTIHKTNKLYLVNSVGFSAYPEHIWADDLSKTYTPYIQVEVTSSINWDGWKSDLYELNAQLILPDGTTIGA